MSRALSRNFGVANVSKSISSALVLASVATLASNLPVNAQNFRFGREDPRANIEGKRASCEVYARIAMVQADANRKFRCGLAGPRWSNDGMAHFRWCRFVPRSAIREEQRGRAQDLQECFNRLGDLGDSGGAIPSGPPRVCSKWIGAPLRAPLCHEVARDGQPRMISTRCRLRSRCI
jgi:hypothetical protein